jgi:bifunctional aspartokinase / homoserine dehydrogenase 1
MIQASFPLAEATHVLVMKFGGSSVADRSCLEGVARIVTSCGRPVVVVVSAMGKTTNALLRTAGLAEMGDTVAVEEELRLLRQLHDHAADGLVVDPSVDTELAELRSVLDGVRLLRELTPRSRALISSIGERLSAPILAGHLCAMGRPARAVDARRFVVTDDSHESAVVDLPRTRAAARELFAPLLAEGLTPVVTGFIGATLGGITTTLGRGGSDYTAALLGSLLDAEEVWIWTDVSGILSADPRLVKEARTLEQVSYREAAEMSYFGAKVLHPKTIGPAVSAAIPIRIKNTFDPQHPGTLVAATSPTLKQAVKTVSSIHDLAVVTIEGRGMAGVPGIARRVFEATEAARVSVVMISQASSEQAISAVVPGVDAAKLEAALRDRFALELAAGAVDHVAVQRDVAIASIVGQGMAGQPGISGKLFGALGAVQVNVLAIAQGASELSISVAVRESEAARAVRAIHSAFGLTRTVHLAILGCGRVARTLLRQIAETRSSMEAQLGLELRLAAVASSRRFLFDASGIALESAPADLERRGESLPGAIELIDRLQQARCTDLVLIDATAADTAPLLRLALDAGIHVVTANKRPLAGSLADFDRLLEASRATGAHLHYETTFGAGLPVLHTLQEMVHTGDRFRSVAGCFSGTLGFICTRLEEGVALVSAVAEARELGLTEPDPREDLSGRDVMRKALIIGRTLGLRLEPEAIALSPLIPHLERGLEDAITVHGPPLARRVAEERGAGRVLRYVAAIAADRVEVGLRAVPASDPLAGLRGQDNMLVYHTERYDQFPLVIRGPGAGAEVTAAGVLGDVLKAVRH